MFNFIKLINFFDIIYEINTENLLSKIKWL
jgi:hypothetical protein